MSPQINGHNLLKFPQLTRNKVPTCQSYLVYFSGDVFQSNMSVSSYIQHSADFSLSVTCEMCVRVAAKRTDGSHILKYLASTRAQRTSVGVHVCVFCLMASVCVMGYAGSSDCVSAICDHGAESCRYHRRSCFWCVRTCGAQNRIQRGVK